MTSTSSFSYFSDGHRYSQSMNRVALLGHIAGIEPSELSAIPTRVASPLAQIEGQLRAVRTTPSSDSITAVVSQQPRPGLEAERHGQEPNCAPIAMKSAGSRPPSRSRASGRSFIEQQSQMRPWSATVREELGGVQAKVTGAAPEPQFYPSVLQWGRKAVSESAHESGQSTAKKQSTIHYIPKRKSYIPPAPNRVTKAIGTESLGNSVLPSSKHETYNNAEHNGRCTSMAAVTLESCAGYEPATPKASVPRSRSGALSAKNVVGMLEDGQNSRYSEYGTGPCSHYPRGFGMAVFEQHQSKRFSRAPANGAGSARTRELAQLQATAAGKKYVREGGVGFEIVSPLIPANGITPTNVAATSSTPRPSFHPLPTSLHISPSQDPASSFPVTSSTRITTSGPTTALSSSPRSFDSVRYSATSRIPSRGAYNPSPGPRPPIIDRVSEKLEQVISTRLRKASTHPPYRVVEFGDARKTEQEDISDWQLPTLREPSSPSGLSMSPTLGPSFKERVSSASGNKNGTLKTLQQNRGKRNVAAYVPDVATAPVQSARVQVGAIPLREQESRELFCRTTTQKRQSLFTPGFEPGNSQVNELSPNSQHSDLQRAGPEFRFNISQPPSPIPKTEMPPSFDLSLKRTDSLFVKTPTSESHDLFSPPWACQ